jgi:hypothetical protein
MTTASTAVAVGITASGSPAALARASRSARFVNASALRDPAVTSYGSARQEPAQPEPVQFGVHAFGAPK